MLVPHRRLARLVPLALALAACLEPPDPPGLDDDAGLGTTAAALGCGADPDCDDVAECAEVCTAASVCSQVCDVNGIPRTCGQYGTCQSCSACTSSSACEDTCEQGGQTTTCGALGVCRSCSYTTCAGSSCRKDCRDLAAGGALVDCNEWGATQDTYGADTGDWDLDRIDDDFEHALAARFYPNLTMSTAAINGCDSDRHLYYGDGDGVPRSVPYVVNLEIGASNGCPYGECIEILYGIPFNWDAGDLQQTTLGDFGIREHRGDSEMYAVLLAHRPQDGSRFWGTTSSATARTSTSYWRAIKHFSSAHMCEPAFLWSSPDSSAFQSEGVSGRTTPRMLWAAEGKHALYFSDDACDAGGWHGSDDCSPGAQQLDWNLGRSALRNAGAYACNEGFDATIASPSWHCYTEPTATESVWSGAPFGESSAWRSKLNTTVLDWRDLTYRCH